MQNVKEYITKVCQETVDELQSEIQKIKEVIVSNLVKINKRYKFSDPCDILDFIDVSQLDISASIWDKLRDDERYYNMTELLEEEDESNKNR